MGRGGECADSVCLESATQSGYSEWRSLIPCPMANRRSSASSAWTRVGEDACAPEPMGKHLQSLPRLRLDAADWRASQGTVVGGGTLQTDSRAQQEVHDHRGSVDSLCAASVAFLGRSINKNANSGGSFARRHGVVRCSGRGSAWHRVQSKETPLEVSTSTLNDFASCYPIAIMVIVRRPGCDGDRARHSPACGREACSRAAPRPCCTPCSPLPAIPIPACTIRQRPCPSSSAARRAERCRCHGCVRRRAAQRRSGATSERTKSYASSLVRERGFPHP